MADCWFDILAQMSKAKREMIKKELSGLTLVGEHIGGRADDMQYVKYEKETLIFYAVVDNASPESCWPIAKAFSFFKKYDLNVVPVVSLGEFTNYNALCDKVEETFKDVVKSPMSVDGEGQVVYFIQKDKDSDDLDK